MCFNHSPITLSFFLQADTLSLTLAEHRPRGPWQRDAGIYFFWILMAREARESLNTDSEGPLEGKFSNQRKVNESGNQPKCWKTTGKGHRKTSELHLCHHRHRANCGRLLLRVKGAEDEEKS